MNAQDSSPSNSPDEEPTRSHSFPPTQNPKESDHYDGDEFDLASKFDATLLDAAEDDALLGRLGSYDIQRVLGNGGMGVVLVGLDTRLRRTVAIKLMSRHLATSPTARRRFIREARAAAAINHDNVVTIYAVEEQRQVPFLVMELIEGESLRGLIRRTGPLSAVDTIKLATQISSGLAAAHAQGVIHRDIKPSNILLDHHLHRAKLSDFGLARAAVDNVELTGDGVIVGTPSYMAPEQVLGRELDPRADLFSLGCVIYAMLAGSSPFHGKTYYEVSRAVTDETPVSLHVLDPRVPKFLSDLVDRLLQKDPDDRPQSAAEVAQVLTRHLSQINQAPSDRIEQILMNQETDTWQSPPRRKRHWPALLGLAIVAVILGVAGTLYYPSGARTVAQDGSARYASLAAALDDARPGTVIRIVGPGTYTGPIVLDDPKFEGVSILGMPGARIAAPATSRAVIRVQNTSGVTLKDLQVDTDNEQLGLHLLGDCSGVQVLDCQIQQSPAAKWAAVYVEGGAEGTAAAPMRLQGLDIQCGTVGVVLGQDDTPPDAEPVRFLDFVDNRVTGPSSDSGVLLILMSRLHEVRIRENTFSSGFTAVSLELPFAEGTSSVVVEDNVFRDASYFLYAEHCSPDIGLVMRNNSIADIRQVLHDEQRRSLVPQGIKGNSWQRPADYVLETEPVATLVDHVPSGTQNPDDPHNR